MLRNRSFFRLRFTASNASAKINKKIGEYFVLKKVQGEFICALLSKISASNIKSWILIAVDRMRIDSEESSFEF